MGSNRDLTLSAANVEELIQKGQKIIIFEDDILRLDSWLDKHPGGQLVILHMVGRDATDEIKAYHSAAICKSMRAFRIARKPTGPWPNMTPSIRGGPCPTKDDHDPIPDQFAAASALRSRSPAESTSSSSTRGSASATGSSASSSVGSRPTSVSSSPERTAYPTCPVELGNWAMQKNLDKELPHYPPVEPDVQQEIIRKYRVLHQKVQDAGLYECSYSNYLRESVRYTILFTLFLTTLRAEWYITSAVFLGLFWHQIMFTAHDAGHRSITKNFVADTLIGMFIADFCCGLSIGWWKSSHNVHHLLTNQPEHDPDIQNLPLFATCPSFFKSLKSSYYGSVFPWDRVGEFLVPYQAYTYYPVMGLARFNLHLLSWFHVISPKASELGGSRAWWVRWAEMACMTSYWYWFGKLIVLDTLPNWPVRVAFVVVSHVVTMPLHVQITLSHWGMSTSFLEDESFPQRQLRTTMDVACPPWLDWIHGGLQFQAVHHLFPRVPRHNLRKVSDLVRDFCEDTGIPYAILGFIDGNQKVLGRLKDVADQLKILAACQQYMAETGESGLH